MVLIFVVVIGLGGVYRWRRRSTSVKAEEFSEEEEGTEVEMGK